MTKGVTNELRLDIEKSTGQKAYAVYQSFSLAGPPNYNLSIGIYSGTAGNMINIFYAMSQFMHTLRYTVQHLRLEPEFLEKGFKSENCTLKDLIIIFY